MIDAAGDAADAGEIAVANALRPRFLQQGRPNGIRFGLIQHGCVVVRESDLSSDSPKMTTVQRSRQIGDSRKSGRGGSEKSIRRCKGRNGDAGRQDGEHLEQRRPWLVGPASRSTSPAIFSRVASSAWRRAGRRVREAPPPGSRLAWRDALEPKRPHDCARAEKSTWAVRSASPGLASTSS